MTKDKPKGGLGKGLDALFGTDQGIDNSDSETANSSKFDNITELKSQADSESSAIFIGINNIKPNPYQPRKEFEENELIELADSIKQKGIIQPVTVRKINENEYELISGERRLRAAKIAGLDKIPVYIIDVNDKTDLLEIALIENIQRSDLNPLEIAEGYKRLIDECGLKHEDIAKKVSKSRSTVVNTLRLLGLPDEIKNSIMKGDLTEGHARAILSVEDDSEKILLWKQIISEKLSVRKTEVISKEKKKSSPANKKKIYEITEQNKAAIKFLEEKFMEHFGTRVKLLPKSPTKGSIIIEYYTAEDLERIIELCKK